jgi:hypothetical protein
MRCTVGRSDWLSTLTVGSPVWHPWCEDGVGIVQEILEVRGGILLLVVMPDGANYRTRGKVLSFGPENLYDPEVGRRYMDRVLTLPKPTVTKEEIIELERKAGRRETTGKTAEEKRQKVKELTRKRVFRRRCKIIELREKLLNDIESEFYAGGQ